MKTWALQDAKARLSTLVEQARRDGPQRITRRGEAMVVVMAAERFDQLTRRRHGHGLVRFFRDSPLAELPQDWLRREDDNGRRAAGMGVELQADEQRSQMNRPTKSKLTGPLTREEAEAIIDGKGPWRLDELSDVDGQVLLDALCPTAPDGSVLLDDELTKTPQT